MKVTKIIIWLKTCEICPVTASHLVPRLGMNGAIPPQEQLYNLLRVKSSLLLIKEPAIKMWGATYGSPLLHLCRITRSHIFEFIYELYSFMVLLNYMLQTITIISTNSKLSRRSATSWRILAPYPTFSIIKDRKRKITLIYVCSQIA